MSGSFENIDVPPTLVSFAVTTGKTNHVMTQEFKAAEHNVYLLKPEYSADGLPTADSLKALYRTVFSLVQDKKIVAAYTPTYGGVAEGLMKMSFGNEIGVAISENVSMDELFGYNYGAFIVEAVAGAQIDGLLLGKTTEAFAITYGAQTIDMKALYAEYENTLESVYPTHAAEAKGEIPAFSYEGKSAVAPAVLCKKPKVLIPVFPGTNCEYDRHQ